MDEQGESSRGGQNSTITSPDQLIDLKSYTSTYEIEEDIKKLRQEIDIRRRARKRLGINEDDEAILILDEKIKLLYPEIKKKQPAETFQKWFFILGMFAIFVLPWALAFPVLWIVPITTFVIYILVRINRRMEKRGNDADVSKNGIGNSAESSQQDSAKTK